MSLYRKLDSLGPSDSSVSIGKFFGVLLLRSLIVVLLAIVVEAPFGYILKPDENFYGSVIMAAVIAPSVEETFKALGAIEAGKKLRAKGEKPYHPKYGFRIGLLFGLIETLLYCFAYAHNYLQRLMLFVVRIAVSVPLHAADTSMFLYGLYIRGRPGRYNRIIYAYLVHGLFNFAMVTG